MTTTLTIRVPKNIKTKLNKLAKTTGKDTSTLAAEAIQNYLKIEMSHIKAIKKAIKEADAGHFAPEEKVKKIFKKWETK